jgi:hypothetical protein
MKLAVFGNRDITDEDRIIALFAQNLHPEEALSSIVYLHGGAAGPQRIILNYLKQYPGAEILFQPWHVIWKRLRFTPAFFYLRNKQIIDNADRIMVFTNGGKDSEVDRVINYCKSVKKTPVVIEV